MVCHAGLVGISTGVVKDKKTTGSKGIKDDLENAGAIWGRIVKDIPFYCKELVITLKGE